MSKGVYNQLSDEYNELYLQNILSFQRRIKNDDKARDFYLDFYPSFGAARSESIDFLIYGQAVNGWICGFEPNKPMTIKNVEESIVASNDYFEPLNHNPLDWVNVQWDNSTYNSCIQSNPDAKSYYGNPYRANRSFFWSVTYKLINDFYEVDRGDLSWTHKMVWSNLHKIAPEDGNPNAYEQEAQMEYSIKLFEQEIREIQPKYCIVMTNGKWWEPFGRTLIQNFPTHHTLPSKIHYQERFLSTKIIVTERPRFGSHTLQDLYVKQILSLIK